MSEQNNPLSDAVRLLSLMLRHKVFLIITFVLTASASIGVAYFMLDVQYASSVSLLPPQRSSGGLGGLMGGISSKLQDFGLGSIGGDDNGVSPMFVFYSRDLIDTTIHEFDLRSRYEMTEDRMSDVRKAFLGNYSFEKGEFGDYTLSVWDTNSDSAALIANWIVDVGNKKAQQLFIQEAKRHRENLEDKIRLNETRLQQANDSLIAFMNEYQMFEPELQAEAALRGLSSLKEEILKLETSLDFYRTSLGSNDKLTLAMEQQLQNLKDKERDIMGKPGFVGDYSLPQTGELGLRYAQLRTDVEVFTRMRAILSPMYQQAVLDESYKLPSMYIAEQAIPADKKARPMRSAIVVGSVFGGFVLSLLFLVVRDRWRQAKQQHPELFGKA